MHRPSLPLLALAALLLASTLAFAQEPKAPKRAAPKKAEAAATLPDNVSVEKDLVYARYGTRELMLDLYRPKEKSSAPLTCIVVVHGGGWKAGDKQRFARHAAYLASQGFAAACIGYRLLPEVGIPECVQDTKAAVRWVRANAARYNLNPDRIGAIGGSAGAHLVALLGTSAKATKLEGNGGNPGVSSRVQAVVAMAAPTDLTAMHERLGLDEATAKAMSPVTYVDRDSAPLLLLHGEADTAVPMRQSEIILAKYQAAGASAKLEKNPGPHGFWNQDRFTETMDRATVFFREKLAK
jgi:acetyl esterase/lipase